MDSDQPESNRYFWFLAIFSALLILAPIRKGDLAGYDDALYAHIAKGVALSGDWINIRSNGGPALEHPPLLVWTEAALFSIFGFSDPVAKLPSALSGVGTVVLVYWLAERLLRDKLQASLAMFVMATSLYFLKYAARAMTDVPCTFLFIASICAWILAQEEGKPAWYILTGVLGALTQLSRGMIGFGLPVILLLYMLTIRHKPRIVYTLVTLLIMFAPLAAWYVHTISANREIFYGVHSTWLRNEVFGPLNPPWRRYTGAFEYLWMISKSYWPYLPVMVLGLFAIIRRRDRRLSILIIWAAVIFVLCAAAKSRVLRYMLPAYPAFAILSAIGLSTWVPERYLRVGLRVVTPLFGVAALLVALFPPVNWHATEIRPIAAAETAATPPGQRFLFYDKGDPRYDEANQLQWYGERNMFIVSNQQELQQQLLMRGARIFVIDTGAFEKFVRSGARYQVLAQSGHLVCLRYIPD
jgi:4-amino-4-deoxy-L-arabinose transferase-like glycosyltransferase